MIDTMKKMVLGFFGVIMLILLAMVLSFGLPLIGHINR